MAEGFTTVNYRYCYHSLGKVLLSASSIFCAVVLFCCCANGEAPQKREGKVTQGQIKVNETVWHGKMPYSPDAANITGLVCNQVDAVSASGPTVVLAAAYRFGSPYTDYYGGQLPRPILVVAVNEESGNIYQADLNKPDHPPIRVMESDKAVEDGKSDGSIESAYFNVDIAALLRLPEEAGRYKLFLWLDDLVSSVLTVNIPVNPARGKGKPVSSGSVQMIGFGTHPDAPKMEAGKAVLALSWKSDQPVVHGSWLTVKVEKPQQPVLWVMFTSHRDRKFGWVAIHAKDLPLDQEITTFNFNVQDLLKTSGIAQKIFIMSLADNGVSKVHVVKAH